MNSKILKLLEFNKITDLLSEQAGSALTRERISGLAPMTNKRMMQDALTETTEAVSVILSKGNIPVGETGDLNAVLGMARKGRILSMRELLRVRSALTAARTVKSFLTSDDMPDGLSVIPEIAGLLEPVPKLENDIADAILSEDEMSDNASPELRSIRREMTNKNSLIRSRLQKMISSGTAKSHLQEAIVTMRNGRYVIPVKKEYINLFPGMVHDQSSTGATLFVEPQAVVNLNNELRQLEMDEQAEITRILELFSSRVGEHAKSIENNQKLLLELDFIGAKGRLSMIMDGREPLINDEGYIDIKAGRHPLIPADKVVPVNIELGRDWTTLLITGPNTGGKTVTLKTIGLMCLMAQSGLHIPADEQSSMPVLKEIFADIGDEQSIEQSLSTFSSHMKNIIDIFASAGEGSLVLLDELGAGTDPLEGAALGIAELERLKDAGCLIAATTHYTELKKYALSTPGVENASMEFDVETLSPTYRLRVGLPGKSNAFEISAKLGLDKSIIDRAAELMGEEQLEFEEAVSRVEADQAEAEAALAHAGREREAAREAMSEAERELAAAREEAARLIEDARRQAGTMLRDAQGTIDDITAELREIQHRKADAGFNEGHIAGGAAESRKKLRQAESALRPADAPKVETLQTGKMPDPSDIKVGMRVKYTKLDQTGEVESLPDSRGNLKLRLGSIRMDANVKDLVIAESEPAGHKDKNKAKYGNMSFGKSKSVSPEINLIGMNLDDATDKMLKYIDDAFLAGLRTVNIIHGRGSGILRKGLRSELRRNKHVESYKAAPYAQGGDGVTVVQLIDKNS
ncbi:MAG: endonuclease MutS2 [Clostridiales bacterium]|jgi:DNA mismatch repair protein MutS2|nr:endonuclease MutS2 [Clostridiales bacterium]